MARSSALKKPVKINGEKPAQKPKCFYSAHAWQCRHLSDLSEILAYVEASGAWETIAEIHPTSGYSAEIIAAYICNLINDNQHNKSLLQEAMDALQMCMETERLTFSSEQMAERIVTRIQARVC
jgi:hypothetical protein